MPGIGNAMGGGAMDSRFAWSGTGDGTYDTHGTHGVDRTVNAYKAVYGRLVDATRHWFAQFPAERCKAVLGLSGGKDSSLCACVLADALGPERVYGVLLPYRKTMGGVKVREKGVPVSCDELTDEEVANIVCSDLGINRVVIDITSSVDSILKQVKGDSRLGLTEKASINIKPRIRMAALYAAAQSIGGFVVNTSNRSELYVGYGTLWGDIVGDYGPIRDLYEEEVVQCGIARDRLPRDFFLRPPADGLTGKTDEEALGVTYDQIRRHAEGEMSVQKELDAYHRILLLHNQSRFKELDIPHPTRQELLK